MELNYLSAHPDKSSDHPWLLLLFRDERGGFWARSWPLEQCANLYLESDRKEKADLLIRYVEYYGEAVYQQAQRKHLLKILEQEPGSFPPPLEGEIKKELEQYVALQSL